MMYIDTSAFLAMVNSDDLSHEIALQTWMELVENNEKLMCNNYILVESIALIQNRMGLEAVATLHNDIIPVLEVEWLDESLHNAITETAIGTNRRALSFVDQSSFNTMRRHKISTAFTFDHHFRQQGFKVIP